MKGPIKPDTVWVLTDGRPGHISQTLGLAEALVAEPVVKRIRLRSRLSVKQARSWGGPEGRR